ncbi:hypothetical protein SCP_0804530 [Sparassis crispa]|uniref:Uncharacterized protein n=1 Tax=Sparassis crispa TaxID=139825 RepID=A0A401GUR4_9APHY|nr:hypothetical protein SCP_0804530 [Sparassis crispa]GBE85929.1 hypothetical protein SCP_0804530 [Sparassis crispa]
MAAKLRKAVNPWRAYPQGKPAPTSTWSRGLVPSTKGSKRAQEKGLGETEADTHLPKLSNHTHEWTHSPDPPRSYSTEY